MSPIDPQNEIEQRMDEAFAAGPDSLEEQALIAFLVEHPEYLSLWEEYQTLRRGIGVLQDKTAPSEMTRARIRHASQQRLQSMVRPRRGWRWLLSQRVIAAATVLLVVGFGIYSQYLLRENKKTETLFPEMEKRELPSAPEPIQVFEEKARPTIKEAAPQGIPAKKMAPPPAPEPSFPKAFAPHMDSGGGAGSMRSLSEGPTPAKAPSPYDRLLLQAKEKIAAQDCPGALKVLKEAQKIQDTPEVRTLITQCEKKQGPNTLPTEIP